MAEGGGCGGRARRGRRAAAAGWWPVGRPVCRLAAPVPPRCRRPVRTRPAAAPGGGDHPGRCAQRAGLLTPPSPPPPPRLHLVPSASTAPLRRPRLRSPPPDTPRFLRPPPTTVATPRLAPSAAGCVSTRRRRGRQDLRRRRRRRCRPGHGAAAWSGSCPAPVAETRGGGLAVCAPPFLSSQRQAKCGPGGTPVANCGGGGRRVYCAPRRDGGGSWWHPPVRRLPPGGRPARAPPRWCGGHRAAHWSPW